MNANVFGFQLLYISLLVLISIPTEVHSRPRGLCRWTETRWKKISGHDDRVIHHVRSSDECKRLCLNEEEFECKSVTLCIRKTCRLSAQNRSTAPRDVKFAPFFTIHEIFCEPRWTSWSSWSACNSSCGPGFQRRTRKCESFSGRGCPGMHMSGHVRWCDAGPCPQVIQH